MSRVDHGKRFDRYLLKALRLIAIKQSAKNVNVEQECPIFDAIVMIGALVTFMISMSTGNAKPLVGWFLIVTCVPLILLFLIKFLLGVLLIIYFFKWLIVDVILKKGKKDVKQ